jgi:hypothetical protein
MAVSIVASTGVFDAAAEQAIMARVFAALLAATDATDNEAVASMVGVTLHVAPAGRMTMGGRQTSSVHIDVAVPAIALGSFRRRRRFIADATDAVVDLSSDPTIRDRVIVQIFNSVDGGLGVGGRALTNDELDEGPEETS